MKISNRSIISIALMSAVFVLNVTEVRAQSAIDRQVKRRLAKQKEEEKKEAEKKAEIPQQRNFLGLGFDIAQDPHRNTNGIGRIEMNTGASFFGAPQLVQPTEKIDLSIPLLYNAEAGMSYSFDGVNPFNLGAKADIKLGPELAVQVSKNTHAVGGAFGGLNGDFALNSRFQKLDMGDQTDWLGRPYGDDYGYTYMKGNAYAGAEYGGMAGIIHPNLSLRGFVGKGTILGATDEMILGEQNYSGYTTYGANFIIANHVRGDVSAKVFNGSNNGIYKGEVYAKVAPEIWLGAKGRVMDLPGSAKVNSIGVGVQWTPNFSAGAR
jgi:hypothetical protein